MAGDPVIPMGTARSVVWRHKPKIYCFRGETQARFYSLINLIFSCIDNKLVNAIKIKSFDFIIDRQVFLPSSYKIEPNQFLAANF